MMARRIQAFQQRDSHPQGTSEGFTLIELLVVIAITALLGTILLPALQRARRHVQAMVCRSHLKQWGEVLALYTEDHQGRFPRGFSEAAWLLRGGSPTRDDPQARYVAHSVRTEEIVRCPRAAGRAPQATRDQRGGSLLDVTVGRFVWHGAIAYGSTFEAWEMLRPEPPFRGSYGFNRWFFTTKFGILRTGGKPQFNVNIFSLKRQDRVPTLLDCVAHTSQPRDADRPPYKPSATGVSETGRFCIDRHDGYSNALFLDWSVRRVGVKELWTLKWHEAYNTAGRWTKAGGVQANDWPTWMKKFNDY